MAAAWPVPGSRTGSDGGEEAPIRTLEFPPGFLWGCSTAAYQIEGAAKEGGRTPSIWDTFSAAPGRVDHGDTGAVACDHYHRWREDVGLMRSLTMPAYRFSISWSRLLPTGRGAPNPEAVAFYGGLIDRLRGSAIIPIVTLYHYDLPQCLEAEYGGWRCRRVVKDFEHYAGTCFGLFGDRVTSWITLNEPWTCAVQGYASGDHAPGRHHAPGREPYVVGHHMLLAHAQAVHCYRSRFQNSQGGRIGIVLNVEWMEPLTSKPADQAAAQRALDWYLGWFADPIWKGCYPASMRARCGQRLPRFTSAEQKLVVGSSDFFGLNHYSTAYVSCPEHHSLMPGSYFKDAMLDMMADMRWPITDMGWSVVPWGLGRICEYIHARYRPQGGIIVTENGCAVREDSAEAAVHDDVRVKFLQGYLAQLHAAIQKGVDVRGYFVWSLMDNFEWEYGYSKRFGIVRVDRRTGKRTLKKSALVFSEIAQTNTLRIPESVLAKSAFSDPRIKAAAPPREGAVAGA